MFSHKIKQSSPIYANIFCDVGIDATLCSFSEQMWKKYIGHAFLKYCF